MAKKKTNRCIHLSRQKKTLTSSPKVNRGRKESEKTIAVKALHTQGYINVCVEIQRDKVGIVNALSMTKVKKKRSNSIGLFIAGGKDIDDKVARANAALRTKEK